MAKGQSFAEKSQRGKTVTKKMVRLVLSVKKSNGHYSFRTKMVPSDEVNQVLADARA